MSVTVSFRKDRGKYQVCYWLDGKRYRPLFDEKHEADSFARRIRLGLSPEDKDSITIDEASKKYFEIESKKKSPKSRSNDKRYLNLHFHFMTYERGIERLKSVDLDDLEAFRDWLIDQKEFDDKPMKMGPSTVNRCLRVLKHFYKRSVQWKLIEATPCEFLDFLESEPKDRRAMTGAEYLKALEQDEDWFKPVRQFMYLTGAAASSVARLTWADVDFEARSFMLLRKKGKAAKWKRIPLAMTDQVFALLVMIRNQSLTVDGPVFRDANGIPLLADRITKAGNRAIRAAGLSGVTNYGMRHGLASDLTAANVATEIIRQALGHASISTTQRYANKIGLRPVAAAIEGVRGGAGGSLVAEIEKRQRIKEGVF